MRSTSQRSAHQDDATTRSRIRDTAILLFGRDGYEATSVRAIAKEAGVSAGLVIHHFSSKDRLREACDEHIVAEVIGRNESLADGDLSTTMQRWLADIDSYRPSLIYLSRMLTDGSEFGDRLFDNLVDNTGRMLADGRASGLMNETSDPRMLAAIIATHGLVPLIFERHLGRAIGESGMSEAAVRRMTIPTLELYTHGLYATDAVLDAARDALHRTAGPQSHKGNGEPHQDPDPPAGSA